jgi:hypothetical protein
VRILVVTSAKMRVKKIRVEARMCELPVVIPAHRCQIPAAAGPPAQLCL